MSQQEVAALVLPHLVDEEGEPSPSLKMDMWSSGDVYPHQRPTDCGSTLCAAGWTAHVLGYIVAPGGAAWKGEIEGFGRHVGNIAEEALELTTEQANWLFLDATEEQAIRCFDEMADGLGFPNEVMFRAD